MKTTRSLIMVFLTAMLLPAAASAGDITKELIVSKGKTRAYYLYLPDKLSTSKSLPLIVLLHGSGHNGLSLVENWNDLAAKEGIILAGPDSSNPVGWATPEDGPDFLRDVVEALKAKYPVNARRIYLFGHSAGAGHAIYMALHESEYFAATAIHAGALRERDYPSIALAKRKFPLAIWVGTVDRFFPLTLVRATRDAMNERGFAVQLTEMAGYDHWYYDVAKQVNKEAWEFLKKHELAEDPRYTDYDYR